MHRIAFPVGFLGCNFQRRTLARPVCWAGLFRPPMPRRARGLSEVDVGRRLPSPWVGQWGTGDNKMAAFSNWGGWQWKERNRGIFRPEICGNLFPIKAFLAGSISGVFSPEMHLGTTLKKRTRLFIIF